MISDRGTLFSVAMSTMSVMPVDWSTLMTNGRVCLSGIMAMIAQVRPRETTETSLAQRQALASLLRTSSISVVSHEIWRSKTFGLGRLGS